MAYYNSMFDRWRRPSTDVLGQREGAVTSVAFDDPAIMLQNEVWSVVGSLLGPDRRFESFVGGLRLASQLADARGGKTYESRLHVVLTILHVKTANDLLAACLLMRAGYALQSFPPMRAALEACEIMEYLSSHPDELDAYIAGTNPFNRDLRWLRDELPETETRRKAYSYFNYFTHNNFKGLNIYTTFDAAPNVVVAHAGPFQHPVPEVVPFVFATALLAYAIRILWESDKSCVSGDWISRFESFDQATGKAFAELPDVDTTPQD